MGSWGIGIFQNDEVLDWINELVEHSDLSLVESTINYAIRHDHLDLEEASQAMGAAEIVAALQGQPGDEMKIGTNEVEDLQKWLQKYTGPASFLAKMAGDAVRNIKRSFEFGEEWVNRPISRGVEKVEDLVNRLKLSSQ
ncbi:DUF4259 domain-containing protein [Paenibacillus sp. JX-17]|uniref:DUF4259 domain-containing protein n=1 Tax=Paenibacillus lacisoli TaxID=3064525 RepID=A0ABT9CHN0_9BACL|nr:DUF4259 domain-containing protein [Paenibacillus sp. JX-17]MDO7908782.1 DUF4259 domain-containing protein [Paenibacillus sp. JX-17]